MNPINNALDEGYSFDEILNFLSNAYPKLNNKIKKAVNAGYPADTIVKFLSNFSQKKSLPSGMTQQAVHAAKKQQDIEENQRLLRAGLQAGTALAGGALARRALQNVAPKVAGLLGRGGMVQTPGQMAAAPVAQAMAGVEKALPQSAIKGLREDFDLLKLTPKIERLAASNAPETIGAMLQKQISPEQIKNLEEKYKKPFSTLVKEYGNSYLQKAEEKPLSREGLTQQFETGEVQREKLPKEEKRKLVALPDGSVGNLTGERQGIGSIELPSGQIRHQKIQDLVEGPDDAAEVALELIKSFTPEQQRSTHHALSFYDPDEKEAYFMFHNGTAYKVNDVTPEEYKNLSEEVIGAKTGGIAQWGEWSAGEGSRGAAYNQIIKDFATPKEGRKHKPYKKLQVGYNVFQEFQRRLNEAEKRKRAERKRTESL